MASNDADRVIEQLQAIEEVNIEMSNWLERIHEQIGIANMASQPAKATAKKPGEEEGPGDILDIFKAGAGGFIGIFTTIMEKFGVFEAIMTALGPTIEIFSDLFSIFGEIMAATILPVLDPLNQALIGLMPLFMPVVEPILEVLMALMQVGLIPMKILFQILEPILGLLLPHVQAFSDLLGGLANFIIDVANSFIDFINKMDVFNWFPDLQRLEKIDLADTTEADKKDEEDRKKAEEDRKRQIELQEMMVDELGGGKMRFLP